MVGKEDEVTIEQNVLFWINMEMKKKNKNLKQNFSIFFYFNKIELEQKRNCLKNFLNNFALAWKINEKKYQMFFK